MTVEINADFGEMMNWAVRYALGRRTYAVTDTVRYVMSLLPHLDDKTIGCMERDIREAFAASAVGDRCDAEKWSHLLNGLRIELKNRKVETWP